MNLCENRADWILIDQMKKNKQISKEEAFILIKNKIDEII
jgi:hypothetical protein